MDLSEFAADIVANVTGFSMLSPKGQPIDLGDEQIYGRFLDVSGAQHVWNSMNSMDTNYASQNQPTDWQFPVLTVNNLKIKQQFYEFINFFQKF